MIPRQPCGFGPVLLLGVGYVLLADGLAYAPRPAPTVGSAATAPPSRRDAPHRAAARGAVRLRFGGRLSGLIPTIPRSVWRGRPPGAPGPRLPSRKHFDSVA